MALNVGNCPRCGKVYVKSIQKFCPACMKEIELQCDQCVEYLQEHRSCSMNELSEAVGISVSQIAKFIREGRISIQNRPNMTYPCETCHSPLREGTICDNCRSRLAKTMTNAQEDIRIKESLDLEDKKVTYRINHRLNDRR